MIWLSILKNVLFKYWKEILYVIAAIAIYFFIYNKGYNSAYQERTQYYEEIRKQEHKDLISKLDSIEQLAIEEQSANGAAQARLARDLSAITKDLKSKKLYIIKNGECVPSQDFLDSYNSIIIRGNRR